MNNFTVHIQPTNKPAIVKFETNKFLTRHDNFEFHNIDEASKSPIAQQLFYLPFVKTVYIAQNFIAIEKYDIVSWEDVQEEVATQIEKFLNEDGVVIKEEKEEQNKNIPVTVYAESTPNPGVMKFATNRKLVLKTVEYKNIDEAKDSPLAQQLFHFPFVKAVFIDANYVSIHKYEMAGWEEITMELREFITNYLQEGKEVLKEETAAPQPQPTKADSQPASPEISQEIKDLDDTSKQVIAILDEYIKPAVASDGGNILFDSYNAENKTVKVILQGACSGCPSSTLTLKNGIETMLRDMLRGKVDYVEAVNG